jgi:hypothetical protein
MAVLVRKLRYITHEELDEICALLQENDIEYHLTGSGLLGMSLPALWIVDDARTQEVRELFLQYDTQRQLRVNREPVRSFGEFFAEHPWRTLFYILAVVLVLLVSIVPFFA